MSSRIPSKRKRPSLTPSKKPEHSMNKVIVNDISFVEVHDSNAVTRRNYEIVLNVTIDGRTSSIVMDDRLYEQPSIGETIVNENTQQYFADMHRFVDFTDLKNKEIAAVIRNSDTLENIIALEGFVLEKLISKSLSQSPSFLETMATNNISTPERIVAKRERFGDPGETRRRLFRDKLKQRRQSGTAIEEHERSSKLVELETDHDITPPLVMTPGRKQTQTKRNERIRLIDVDPDVFSDQPKKMSSEMKAIINDNNSITVFDINPTNPIITTDDMAELATTLRILSTDYPSGDDLYNELITAALTDDSSEALNSIIKESVKKQSFEEIDMAEDILDVLAETDISSENEHAYMEREIMELRSQVADGVINTEDVINRVETLYKDIANFEDRMGIGYTEFTKKITQDTLMQYPSKTIANVGYVTDAGDDHAFPSRQMIDADGSLTNNRNDSDFAGTPPTAPKPQSKKSMVRDRMLGMEHGAFYKKGGIGRTAPIIHTRAETDTDRLLKDYKKTHMLYPKPGESNQDATLPRPEPIELTAQIKKDLIYKKQENMFRRKLDFILSRFMGLEEANKEKLRKKHPEIFRYWYDTCVARIRSYKKAARFTQHPIRTRDDMKFVYASLSPASASPLNTLGLQVIEMLIGFKGVKGSVLEDRYEGLDPQRSYKKGFISRFLYQGMGRKYGRSYEYDNNPINRGLPTW